MRFVFTAPRYHTNQHFAVKALLDAGHEVSFLALRRGQSEVYDAIHPIVLGRGVGLVRLWGRVWRQMRALRPDAVVVRNPLTGFGLLSIAAARLTGRSVVLYTLTPMHMRFRWWQKLKGWGIVWISRAAWTTPVLGQPDRHPPGLGRDAVRAVRDGAADGTRSGGSGSGTGRSTCCASASSRHGRTTGCSLRRCPGCRKAGHGAGDGNRGVHDGWSTRRELAEARGASGQSLGLGDKVRIQDEPAVLGRTAESTQNTTCSCCPAGMSQLRHIRCLEAMAHSLAR